MTSTRYLYARNVVGGLTVLGAFMFPPIANAADEPTLHVGYAYSSCYIDLHPELTADQFHLFAREFADAVRQAAAAAAGAAAPAAEATMLNLDATLRPSQAAPGTLRQPAAPASRAGDTLATMPGARKTGAPAATAPAGARKSSMPAIAASETG